MTIHVLPPASDAPTTPPAPPTEPPEPAEPLDPFWAAVRRRRPDLPLVLLGDPSGDTIDDPTTGSGSGSGR